MHSVTAYLYGRIAHELDALRAEKMVSSRLLVFNASDNAKMD